MYRWLDPLRIRGKENHVGQRTKGQLTRRDFLGSLAAVALLPAAGARSEATPPIRVQGLNHMTLMVSDPARSLAFYQGLFGMPVQAQQGPTPCLRIGAGPQFLALTEAPSGAPPGIHHFCMSVEDFDPERLGAQLAAHGVPLDGPEATRGAFAGVPLRATLRQRDAAHGGAPGGTPELYLTDPDGILVQLQDTRYCGGSGRLGDQCAAPSPAAKGAMALRGINHFTVFVTDAKRSLAFYQRVFGLPITKTQGSMPLLDAGTGGQILGFVDAGGRITEPKIHHACVTIDGFEHEQVLTQLASHGIQTRPDPLGGPIEPLSSYVTMRMPDRGGAPGGTPELYFTDPDGILIQIQDRRYCGGAGYLGEACAYV